jgi:hypothetical protein
VSLRCFTGLQPGYTLGMVRFDPSGEADDKASSNSSASSGHSGRPQGIALSSLAIAVLLAIGLARQLLQLWGRPGSLSPIPGARLGFALMLVAGYGIAGLCLWQYWKGQNWARILVLLWSFASAASAVSFLADHNLDPAALMSRPLSFFQAILASVLLYWLNTPAVRAWFRKVSANAADLIGDRLGGRLCTGLAFRAGDAHSAAFWRLNFEHDAELILHCPWRIVLDDNLAFVHAPAAGSAALPHAPAAGSRALPDTPDSAASALGDDVAPNPAPNSPDEARRLLQNLRVTGVRIARRSSDLFVSFEMGIELQTWSADAGAPASASQWKYRDPGLMVIADDAGVRSQFAHSPVPEATDQDARRQG